MLKFESYWETLPLNNVPEQIVNWYKGEAACQAILINPDRTKIMLHFRYSSHLWVDKDGVWLRTCIKVPAK